MRRVLAAKGGGCRGRWDAETAGIAPLLAYGAYALVSILWFIPDRLGVTSGDRED